MQVGIAGTGRMGTAMAERLLAEGHAVRVWNRTADRTGEAVRLGAEAVESARALAADCAVVLSILFDAEAVDAVYNGPQGLLDGVPPGRLFVEMSTVRPQVTRALGERVRAAGAVLVECPVGGTTGPARQGALFGFAGGAAEDVARARPVLDALCRRVEHVGPLGAGASMKLAINLPLAISWQALGEALALCRRLGLSGADLAGIFADTSGATTAMKNRQAVVARALDGEAVPGTFDVDGMCKDLATMLAEGAALGAAMPVTEAALAAYREAAERGLGGLEPSNLSDYWSRKADDPASA